MDNEQIAERNQVLDEILMDRRSIRAFSEEIPSKADVEAVIFAGQLAPYAAMSVGTREDYRRFVVVPRDSDTMARLKEILDAKAKEQYESFSAAMAHNPDLHKQGAAFAKNLKNMAENGVRSYGSAAFNIIVAEIRGIPDTGSRSLAHCMQNMWLKATALGLAFQLVSITGQMSDDPDFCEAIGLNPGEFSFDGCGLGYPAQPQEPRSKTYIPEYVTWL
jgi:nitroreductase